MFKFAFYKMLLNYNQFIFKVSTKCFQTTTLTIFCLFIVALSVAEKAKHLLMLQKPALDALGIHSNIVSLCYMLRRGYCKEMYFTTCFNWRHWSISCCLNMSNQTFCIYNRHFSCQTKTPSRVTTLH